MSGPKGPTSNREDTERQTRVCRSCRQSYAYPVLRSLATRFHCESCVSLPAETRATFERLTRRINDLESRLARLEREASGDA